ncbi:uncharacterized protein LOC130452439 [Diorhabda sublineata]|uniref:uncharacterized protein LOC130452439 n=1 Tax=Diorhabda sublineata TaxID=1163346 RepID=UPI0024E11DD6|nr:uncharacterized protein LOC130452439 [Diorhabda sublineata]
MMGILFKWFRFYLCLSFFQLCNGNPVNQIDTEIESNAKFVAGVISLLFTVCFLVFIVACLCCQRRKRFQQFRDSPVTASSIPNLDHGHVNPIASGEFTIFSPLSPHFNNNVFHEDKPNAKSIEDPLANSYDISPWFNSNENDFPRNRLKYIKELGSGWFGKVVEGAIQDDDNKKQNWTPVVVRILEATSSQNEKILFLQNAEIYKIGNHTNILTLVGRSLETVPYLLLQEWCSQGDLKAYLRSQKTDADQFLSTEYPLLWCYQLTSALKYIHEHDIVHLDLASRNCQLTNNLILKLGDYGLGPFKYPADYYQGQPTVPVRWCSPESLIYTQTTIQPKRVTPEANVWALAVTMWEICECGDQPYWDLSDDDVISQVLGPTGIRLRRPAHSVLYTDYIYRLMQLCWTSAESRPKVVQIHTMLTDLLQVHKNTSRTEVFDVDEFDRRWESCKPNTIIKTDHIAETVLESEGDDLRKSLSLSLTNLHGSLDNLAFYDQDVTINEQTTKSSDAFNCEDSIQRTTSSGSETEEENWRNKVERGAYTEKVRQKSRSVADLMVLTHVDYSESESETPLHSLEYRINYKNVRLAGLDGINSLENTTSIMYGSEGNLLNVQDTFKEELRRLKEERRDSLLFVPDNVSQINSFRSTETSNAPSSRLIHELNNPLEIQPPVVNQVFNIYNVTIDNFSPVHMNKLSDILDVNSQLKPEWRKAEKLKKINCELNQEIRELEKLNNVQKVYSAVYDQDDFNGVESDNSSIQNLEESNPMSQNSTEVVKVSNSLDLNRNVKETNLKSQQILMSNENLDIIPDLNQQKLLKDEVNSNQNTIKLIEINEHDKLNFIESNSKLYETEDNDSALEAMEIDCDRSKTCNNLKNGITNLTFEVLANDDSLLEDKVACEAFNFNIRLPIETNETALDFCDNRIENKGDELEIIVADNLVEQEEKRDNTETNCQNNSDTKKDQQSSEETVLIVLNEIVTRSLDEILEKAVSTPPIDKLCHSPKLEEKQLSVGDTDQDNTEQIVNFDLSFSQEEVMPNSLTHSSLFTSSTPFNKRSLENKFSSMKFEDNYVPDNSDLNYSLETWDNFLGSTMDHQNQHNENMFDSFSSEPQSLLFIDGEGVNETFDKFQDVESKSAVLSDAMNCPFLANLDKKKETSSKSCDVFSNTSHVFNSTYIKEGSDALQVYSGDIWNKYLEHPPGKKFDDFSSEPRSLIFIESEGVYKTCDNVDEVNRTVHVDDDTPPGTSENCVQIHSNTVDLQPTYNNEDGILNSTFTKEEVASNFGYSIENDALNITYTKEDDVLNTTYSKEESEVLKSATEDLDEGSFENGGGWFLHPQPTNELSGEIQVQSPCTDSYVGFGIDDEIMSAIRNELLTKLPHAQGNHTERVKEEDDWDTLERHEVFLRYNVYPLSPIPEESLIEDVSGTNTPRQEREEEIDWSGRTDTDTVTNDNETISANTLESPLRGTFNRHTPSQDSCCSNDTLFNLEDLICGPIDQEKDVDFVINTKSIEEAKTEKPLDCDERNENVEKNDGKEIKDSTTVCSQPQDIVNNFLTTERNYSAGVQLPSPEENPWKQLPATLLNYNQCTFSNSHSIKEESYSDCDNVEKQRNCDVGNIELKLKESTADEYDNSEHINVTLTKDQPDVVDISTLSSESNKIDSKLEEIEVNDKDKTLVIDENIDPYYSNVDVKGETEKPAIENEENDGHLYENTDVKNSENVDTGIDQFDDYVNIVNMENSRNRLESDVADNKNHAYINAYDKEEDDSIYGILTDIRFSGPGDSQMMSTSFSENNDEQGWESGSDSRSSSSGEFIWREGEHEEYLKALRAAPQDVVETVTPMEGTVEDNYEESDLSSNFSDEEESPEFVPSAWDKFAMPSKSAMRSPEKTPKKREEKKPKGVWFKKQKYHCIYEYPKEPESPILQTPEAWKQPEFKVFTDSPISTNLADDFFMTSSDQPFQTHSLSSQFFPGNSTWTFDNATPDSGMEDITPGSVIDSNEFPNTTSSVPTLKQLASEIVNRKKLPSLGSSDSLGGLRHTKKLLKLDLPPSPSAFCSDKMFTIEPTVEPVVREKPTFTTFGKSRFMVQHVETPPDASLIKNVSFEALPYKPMSPILDDSSLTSCKIEAVPNKQFNVVDDLSRSDTDLIERNFAKNEYDDKCKLKVEVVRGEASVLDSGDEDSGIESTSTLERKICNP